MSYTYDLKNNILFHKKRKLLPDGLEQNFVGTCSKCSSDVISVSYHTYGDRTAVAARCTNCGQMYAIIYDANWNWVGEHFIDQNDADITSEKNICSSINTRKHPEDLTGDLKILNAIPKKKLETVFTPAEIDTMFAKAAGKKHVRQYLYRARKKYEDFHELFGIYLNV